MDDDLTDDELVAELIRNLAIDVLERIGSDPEARYRFFREFVKLAEQAVSAPTRFQQQ